MKKKKASPAHIDLRALIQQSRYQELINYAHEAKQEVFLKWLDGTSEELQQYLRYQSALLDEVPNLLRPEKSSFAFLLLGSLMGTVESFERAHYETQQSQWTWDRLQEEGTSIKHLSQVVQMLEVNGAMTHKELSSSLKMNPPTLSEAMKKILETGAVQVSSSGKYKIYTLTDAGLRYGRDLRKRRQGGSPLSAVTKSIQELMVSAPNSAIVMYWENLLIRAIKEGATAVSVHNKEPITPAPSSTSSAFDDTLLQDTRCRGSIVQMRNQSDPSRKRTKPLDKKFTESLCNMPVLTPPESRAYA
jgi:DNA-binding MarR family transcriptional regulator